VILSGLYVVASTANTLTIEWSTDESSDSGVGFGVADVASRLEDGADVLSHRAVLTNLDPATTYQYQVESTDPAGNGATRSRTFLAKTAAAVDLVAPRITKNPSVIYKTERQATITWETDEGSPTFLEFGAGESLVDQQSLPNFVTKHQVTLTNLTAGTPYQYRVQATDASSNGPTPSQVLTFTTESGPDLVAPEISVAPVAEAISDLSAVIKWTTNELSDSGLNFAEGSGLSANALGLVVGSSSDVLEHQVALTNLTANTTYSFYVQSTDRSSNGPVASDVLLLTTLAGKDETAPSAPLNVAARGALGQLVIAWSVPPEPDVAGYDVFRAIADGPFSPLATLVPNPKYVDDGLDAATVYRYQILSVDASGNQSTASDAASGTPDGSGLPGAPSAIGVEGQQQALVVENVTGAPGILYNFIVASEETFDTIVARASGVEEGAATDRSNSTAWIIDAPLTEGTTYYWRAWVFDGEFDGPFMETASFVASSSGGPVVEPPVVTIANLGDFDGDLVVGFGDFLMFVSGFGSAEGQPRFNKILDVTGDKQVGFADFISFVKVFGKRYAAGKMEPKFMPEDTNARSSLKGPLPNVGQVFDITVHLQGAADLSGYGFELWYDPTIVSFEEAIGVGPFGAVLSQGPGTVSFGGSVAPESDALAHLSFRLINEPRPSSGPFAGLADLVISGPTGDARRVRDRAELVALPSITALKQNYPNPFNPETTIPYTVANEGPVSLRIYNTLGQQVTTLVNDGHSLGYYQVVWDGRDAFGHHVASGIYMVRMAAPDYTRVSKILLLK
jgi:chitodextrinase